MKGSLPKGVQVGQVEDEVDEAEVGGARLVLQIDLRLAISTITILNGTV